MGDQPKRSRIFGALLAVWAVALAVSFWFSVARHIRWRQYWDARPRAESEQLQAEFDAKQAKIKGR